jgi:hypothetical protein
LKKTEISKQLTGDHDSYLHITFEGASWKGVQTFLSQLKQKYSSVKGRTFQVEEGEYFMNLDEVVERLKQEGSFSEICTEDNNAAIRKLEAHLQEAEGGMPFVDITFLTQDLNLTQNEMRELIPVFETWKDELEATNYYVRYENAMWEIGDVSPESGVIHTSGITPAETNR